MRVGVRARGRRGATGEVEPLGRAYQLQQYVQSAGLCLELFLQPGCLRAQVRKIACDDLRACLFHRRIAQERLHEILQRRREKYVRKRERKEKGSLGKVRVETETLDAYVIALLQRLAVGRLSGLKQTNDVLPRREHLRPGRAQAA